ncbi:MAG TPA: YgcG family protein [Candidatus Woesebacteria bacterium]|nr:YgcG family protein [Candidatus Woesebacteria bacterium]
MTPLFLTQQRHRLLYGFSILFAFCTLHFVLCASLVSAALSLPEPRGYVNDYAQILNSNAVSALENKLSAFNKSTTNQIVVVTVPDLQDTTLEDFATRLFEKWKIGTKEKDNGVLLLVAQKEREVRIEVGYGLEPVLNDAKAGRIIRDIIIPEFKAGNYDAGVTKGSDAIVQIVGGDDSVLPATSSDSQEDGLVFPLMVIFFFASGILQYLFAFLARSKSAMPGGIIGVVLGIIISALLAFPLFGFIATPFALGVFGYLLDAALSKNYQTRKGLGLPTAWHQSGGGFFGGGGRSSGGGFGGFGGGRSGGGGVSGRL